MKIELGGGNKPIGNGFLNIDLCEEADLRVDLEAGVLPFEANSVDEVYSAHCLEHIQNYLALMRDMLRVTKVGASVVLHLPHWNHPFAMTGATLRSNGHAHVLSDRLVRTWHEQPELFWAGTGKRLMLTQEIHYQIDEAYHELRPLFPHLTDLQVAKYIPCCCHEIHCYFRVEAMM